MKNIVKDLQELRELIVTDCAADEQLLTLEERQWIDRIDKIILNAKSLLNNVALANVSHRRELLIANVIKRINSYTDEEVNEIAKQLDDLFSNL